jgi:hypothetical protein
MRYVFASLAARQPTAAELHALVQLRLAADEAADPLALVASTLMASDVAVMVR